MKTRSTLLFLSALTGLASALPAANESQTATVLRAVLASPGGELPFHLELLRASPAGPVTSAVIRNGSERIELTNVAVDAGRLEIHIDHYASSITAVPRDGGRIWDGTWTRSGRGGKVTRMAFFAMADPGYRFGPLNVEGGAPQAEISGRWRATFSQSSEPAIGEFRRAADGTVEGTFLTPGGDYRYLAGDFADGRLRLSCFDGSHAYLFDARLQEDGTLAGHFWSGDSWHETWTAQRDDAAQLPDGFSMVQTTGRAELSQLCFRDLEGRERCLAELIGDGRACVLEIFGSWCPNCLDASRLLDELQDKYAGRGLRVIGLAWEYTGDFQQDAAQVRRYLAHCRTKYPVLYGGPADREEIARKLPFIAGVKAYPTIIFLAADGTVNAIYTGFSGPATGGAYQQLRADFERIIERGLAGE